MQVKLGERILAGLSPKATPYEIRDTAVTGLVLRVQPSGIMTYYCEFRNTQGERIESSSVEQILFRSVRPKMKH